MIDNLAIGITHLLLVIAIIRLLGRADLDKEPVKAPDAADTPDQPSVTAPLQSGPSGSRVGVMRLPKLGAGGLGGGKNRV
ncbi:hypothetical protein [Novosphingobium rosa]|uniref:hypothetical protein n=1 Tax=Novosphingobium rosa TaxID=76978 RepID=UPI000835AB0B|nr:hypothetical protein [Novosphingobium rosa]